MVSRAGRPAVVIPSKHLGVQLALRALLDEATLLVTSEYIPGSDHMSAMFQVAISNSFKDLP